MILFFNKTSSASGVIGPFAASAIIFAFSTFGQHDHSKCATSEELIKLYESDPSLQKQMEKSFSSKTKLENEKWRVNFASPHLMFPKRPLGALE